jgi:hypothetical protein
MPVKRYFANMILPWAAWLLATGKYCKRRSLFLDRLLVLSESETEGLRKQ